MISSKGWNAILEGLRQKKNLIKFWGLGRGWVSWQGGENELISELCAGYIIITDDEDGKEVFRNELRIMDKEANRE